VSQGTFIVYACPVGALNDQVAAYFLAAQKAFGPNPAHEYMPHCTLTGFFQDAHAALPLYGSALAAALADAGPAPTPAVEVVETLFRDDFHGLALTSPWLTQLTASFAQRAHSPTRQASLRLKTWLHLSFAYGFAPEQGPGLARLARAMIDPTAPARWELRLYERQADHCWALHAAWALA